LKGISYFLWGIELKVQEIIQIQAGVLYVFMGQNVINDLDTFEA
jgi:hypothetical protein